MNLKDIKTLTEVSREHNIPLTTLQHRLKNLKEGEEYRGLGKRMPTILTPGGVEKIIRGRGDRQMGIKEIRAKGFEFFCNNGKMPTELLINGNDFQKLLDMKDADMELTPESTYYDGLFVTIDNEINEFEVR